MIISGAKVNPFLIRQNAGRFFSVHLAAFVKALFIFKYNFMVKNMLKMVGTLMCLMICLSVSAQEKKQDVTKYAGSWTFSAPEAPYGYQDGTVVLEAAGEGKLAGIFIVDNYAYKAEFKETENGFAGSLDVDGYPTDIVLTLKDGKPEAVAYAGGMTINILLTAND
ncbi:hypothetical protein Barb7_00345 [Bacteroidales bacterium Barb7]|nr:hypothetical protein Barb7_00345 [Bacteroidales bacterium Barb7]